MSIFDYFLKIFHMPPMDVTLAELPVNSNCGKDCMKAINAGRTLLRHWERAHGKGRCDERTRIIAAVEEIIAVYWRG